MIGGVSAGTGGGGLGSYGMDVSAGYDMGSPTVEDGGTTSGSSTPALQEVDGFEAPEKTGRIDARSERIEETKGPEKPQDRVDLEAFLEELRKMTAGCGQCGQPMVECKCLFGA